MGEVEAPRANTAAVETIKAALLSFMAHFLKAVGWFAIFPI